MIEKRLIYQIYCLDYNADTLVLIESIYHHKNILNDGVDYFERKIEKLGDKKRHTFQGTFEFNGYKKDKYKFGQEYENATFMLSNLKIVQGDNLELVTDHIWMNLTKQFLKFGWLKKEIWFNLMVVSKVIQVKRG